MRITELNPMSLEIIERIKCKSDAIAVRWSYYDNIPRFFLIPDYMRDISFESLDPLACIEYTLHQALENDISSNDLYFVFGFMEGEDVRETFDEEEIDLNVIYIDLDYYIPSNIFAAEIVD